MPCAAATHTARKAEQTALPCNHQHMTKHLRRHISEDPTHLLTQGVERAYLPWTWIVAAKLAQKRGDAAAAIAYSKAYVDCGDGDGIAGYECEAQTWEQLHNPQRARESWLDALANGSNDAKAALRRLWPNAPGSDGDFDTYLSVQLLARRPPNEREKAPSFACVDMAGKDASRDALRGRVVVLNFWGLGCTPCKLEIPSLNELANTYAGRSSSWRSLQIAPRPSRPTRTPTRLRIARLPAQVTS